MKKVFMIVALLSAGLVGKAQYFSTVQNLELNYINYDEAGQSIANITTKVEKVVKRGSAVEAQYVSKIVTNKNKNNTSYALTNWSYDGKQTICDEDLMYAFYIEADRDPQKYDRIARKVMNDERKYEGNNSFAIPEKSQPGQALPDRSYQLVKNMLKHEYNITGVVILGNEQLSTTAGKFQCVKISYLVRNKVMLKSKNHRVTEWYAKGVGLVKSETHDLEGKLEGKTILVKRNFFVAK